MIISVTSQGEEPWFVFAQHKEPLQEGFYQCDLRDLFFSVETIYTGNVTKGYYQKFKTINVSRGTISDKLPPHLEFNRFPSNSQVRKLTGKIEVKVEVPSPTSRNHISHPHPNPALSALGIPAPPQTETTPENTTPRTP